MSFGIEMLLQHHASEREIRQLAKLWEIPHGSSSQLRLLHQHIAAAYTADNVNRRFAALSGTQQDILNMLAVLSVSYREAMPVELAARKINERLHTKGVGEKTLRELAVTGLLFMVEDRWRERVIVPLEVWSALVGRLAEHAVKRIGLQSRFEGEAHVTVNAGLALYQDMLTLLAACVHEPVEVSQKGHIYKRTMNRILQSMRTQEEWFPQHWEGELPRQFYFIVSFFEKESVLDPDEYVKVNANALEPFLAVDYIDWAKLIHSYYMQCCRLPDGTVYSFMHSVMYRLGREGWIPVEAAMREMTRMLSEWRTCPTREQMEQICIRPYVAMGLMKLANDQNGERLFQWTEWGKEYILLSLHNVPNYASQLEHLMSEEVFVQPNLEIMVPENALPAIRWKVEALAHLKQVDSVLIYELSKERIIQALDAGWTLDNIRHFLDTYSKIPVTDNVYQTIRGWIGNYGKAELWDVMVLRVENADAAARLSQDKRLSKLIVAHFSPECLVIQRSNEQKVRELLNGLGYPTAYRVRNPDVSSASRDRNEERYSFTAFSRSDKGAVRSSAYGHNLGSIAPDYCNFALEKEEVLTNEFGEVNPFRELFEEMDDDDDDDEYEF
jgi:hypothetical protein